MQSIPVLILFLLLAVPFPLAHGATEFEEAIPIDVARTLFDSSLGANFAFYTDLPDEFPPIELPIGLRVLGSVAWPGYTRVAVQTDLNEQVAVPAFLELQLIDDWVELPSFRQRGSGFVSAVFRYAADRLLCHDVYGHMGVAYLARAPGATNLMAITLIDRTSSTTKSCAELVSEQEEFAARTAPAEQIAIDYLPRLDVPFRARQNGRRAMLLPARRGTSWRAESDANIEIDWELEELYAHFAEQLREQGWAPDVQASGSMSSVGSWTHSPQQDINLVGRLNVIRAGEGEYSLSIRIEQLH